MMTRRQALRSLAAALAAVVPVPVVAAETGIIDIPGDQGFPVLYDTPLPAKGQAFKVVKIEPTRLNGHTFQLNVRYQYRNDGDWHAVGE